MYSCHRARVAKYRQNVSLHSLRGTSKPHRSPTSFHTLPFSSVFGQVSPLLHGHVQVPFHFLMFRFLSTPSTFLLRSEQTRNTASRLEAILKDPSSDLSQKVHFLYLRQRSSKSASSGLSTPREDAATTNTLKVRSLPPGAWPFLEMPGPHFGIHCTNAGFARAALVLSAKPCDENQQTARGSGIPTCGVRKPARLPSEIRTSNLEIGPDMSQIRPWASSLFLPNPFTQD